MRRFTCQPRCERSGSRAITLVELMVTVAVGAVILAVLLNTFSHTQRLARRQIHRNRQRQEALLTLERVSAIIADAVPLTALDATAEIEAVFESDHLRLASWRGADADHLWVHEVAHEIDDADQRHLILSRFALDGSPAPQQPRRSELSTWIDLRYASAPEPGGEIRWQPTVANGDFPALVHVTVAAHSPHADRGPFEVSTVVVTGAGGAP